MKLNKILNESNRDAFNRSLTREQKREIMDSVSRFNDFGSKLFTILGIAPICVLYCLGFFFILPPFVRTFTCMIMNFNIHKTSTV